MAVKEEGRGKRHFFSCFLFRGHSLPPEIVVVVCSFNESDDISLVMPEKKDFVLLKKEGKCQPIPKQLILSNLREMYLELKGIFPDRKIGFAKFAELRPKHSV